MKRQDDADFLNMKRQDEAKSALEMRQQSDALASLKSAYESELEKNRRLSRQLQTAEQEAAATEERLAHIKGSRFWRMSLPARSAIHWLQRTKDRVARYGSLKGILRKLDSKRIEKQAMLQHGTASFPDAEETKRQRAEVFARQITFSILVPLYNTPEKFLREAIDSVLAQTYADWQLCLADGSDAEHGYVEEICREYIAKEEDRLRRETDSAAGNTNEGADSAADRLPRRNRISYRKLDHNGGISENTNRCLELATGNFIGLFDHDDILHPSVLYEYAKAICEQDADYLYCDETTFSGDGIDHMLTLHFKPDFAIDTLRANNYICHFSVFDRTLLEGEELFRSAFDGSQDHDMILRLTTKARHVVHIPKLMYYWRSHAGSTAADINAKTYAIEAARGAVADHLTRQGFSDFQITSTKAFETIFRIQYAIEGNPKISILIPNKDHKDDLERCLTSIREKTTYDHYEIIIVENNSTSAEIRTYYESLQGEENIRILKYEGTFNYAAINNMAAEAADGEYLVLLNNDTQVITPDWLEELLMYAQRPDVAAVGAKLYYGDRTIQHAGVVIGLGAHRTAGHTHYREASTNLGYMGRLCYAQNVTAVTGACLMVKKALYQEVGGLSEEFAISLNDVDFCLKLRKAGYLNVFTPFAELYHYESVSRGLDDQGEKAARYDKESALFREKWAALLAAGDPYYNPNFSLDRSDFALRLPENRQ